MEGSFPTLRGFSPVGGKTHAPPPGGARRGQGGCCSRYQTPNPYCGTGTSSRQSPQPPDTHAFPATANTQSSYPWASVRALSPPSSPLWPPFSWKTPLVFQKASLTSPPQEDFFQSGSYSHLLWSLCADVHDMWHRWLCGSRSSREICELISRIAFCFVF